MSNPIERDSTASRSHRPKGLLTNALWSSGYVVSTMVLSFLITPILIRHLGKASYGVLLLIWSVSGVLGTLNLGLGEATLRYVARHFGRNDLQGVNRVFDAVLSLFSIVCSAILLSVFVGAEAIAVWLNTPPELTETVSWLLRLSALSIAVSIITSLFGAVPLALQRYDINSKITMGSSIVRSLGYIALAAAGLDIVSIVVWDLIITLIVFCLIVTAARRLIPQLQFMPTFRFGGLREVIGYSIFSFLTYFLHKLHRESGKLMLARYAGPIPVVHLATPDNVVQRFHEVIASGIEATLPRFSAASSDEAERLYWATTWTGLALSIVVFVPVMALAPAFLSLWIDAEFASHSGFVAQLLALYLISQGGFSAPAAYFRGVGKPWIVTGVIFGSLVITIASGLILVPDHGAIGAAYAYLAGSAAPFLGMCLGSVYAFGAKAIPKMLRTIGVAIVAGAFALAVSLYAVSQIHEFTWFLLVGLVVTLGSVTTVFVFGSDAAFGGENKASLQLLRKAGRRLRKFSSQVAAVPNRS